MLGIIGATVASVTFTPTGVVVGLRRRRSKPVCPCGGKSKATYDRSAAMAASRSGRLEAVVGGRDPPCRLPGVRAGTEVVPWARPGVRHTRDVQDLVAFMA